MTQVISSTNKEAQLNPKKNFYYDLSSKVVMASQVGYDDLPRTEYKSLLDIPIRELLGRNREE